MSVYSGFATRLNEQQYNKQIVNLIKVLQRRVIKFYRSEPADEDAFKLVFQQIYTKLIGMEDSKYNEPYYGSFLEELCNFLSIDQKKRVQSSQPKSYNQSTCNCKCHHNQSMVQVNNPQAFMTNIDMSKDRIQIQPLNISQDRILTKIQFDHLTTSVKPYQSVSRPTSKRQNLVRSYQNYQTSRNDSLLSGRVGQRSKENKSLELNFHASTQDHSLYQRSPITQLKTQTKIPSYNQQQQQANTQIVSNRSPYYTTVYSLNGKTYNKVSYHKNNQKHKVSTTPRNISTSPHTNNKFYRNISINKTSSSRPVQHHSGINEGDPQSQKEVDSRTQIKRVLPKDQKQTMKAMRSSVSQNNKYLEDVHFFPKTQTNSKNFNSSAMEPFHQISNPNESIINT